MTKLDTNRRETIKALLAISAAGALAACKAKPGEADVSPVPDTNEAFLTASEYGLLTVIAQTIIPRTDTPGAGDAGVPDMIQSLLTQWSDDTIRVYWRAGLSEIDRALGPDFVKMPEADRHSVLEGFDSQVFAKAIKSRFYKDMKRSIVGAYYMSEAGATEELHYDPVPGDFRGCVPFSEIGKAWAT